MCFHQVSAPEGYVGRSKKVGPSSPLLKVFEQSTELGPDLDRVDQASAIRGTKDATVLTRTDRQVWKKLENVSQSRETGLVRATND